MYELVLSASDGRLLLGKQWNLGALCVTSGVMNALDDGKLDPIEPMLYRHLTGDYGVIGTDPVDLEHTIRARNSNRSFTSVYVKDGLWVKVASHPSLDRTVVCLMRED